MQPGLKVANFVISTSIPSAKLDAVLEASLGLASKSCTLKILPALSQFIFSPATCIGGRSIVGKVYLNVIAPGSGLVVHLNANQACVSTPTTVTVDPGKNNASFVATTTAVSSDTDVTINASYGGQSIPCHVTVQAPHIQGINFTPAKAVGGSTLSGIVVLNGIAPDSGADVALNSGSADLAVPTSVHIAAGSRTATFAATTSPVSVDEPVTVTATTGAFSSSRVATVQAPYAKLIKIAQSTLYGGNSAVGTMTLVAPAPAAGLDIVVQSNNACASVSSPVHFAGGATVATFGIVAECAIGPTKATITSGQALAYVNVIPNGLSTTSAWPAPQGDAYRSKVGGGGSNLGSVVDRISITAGGHITGPIVLSQNGQIYCPFMYTRAGDGKYVVQLQAINPSSHTKTKIFEAVVEPDSTNLVGNIMVRADGSLIAEIGHNLQAFGPGVHAPTWSFPNAKLSNIGPDGTIYAIGTDDFAYPQNLTALRPSGALKWVHVGSDTREAGVTVGVNGDVYSVDNSRTMECLNSTDGSVKWTYSTYGQLTAAPVVNKADGTIYIGSYDGFLYAINPDGSTKWNHDFNYNEVTGEIAISAGGTVYVSATDYTCHALSSVDGTELGTHDGLLLYPVSMADGAIVSLSSDGLLCTESNFVDRWLVQQGGANPVNPIGRFAVTSSGNVIVATQEGEIIIIK